MSTDTTHIRTPDQAWARLTGNQDPAEFVAEGARTGSHGGSTPEEMARQYLAPLREYGCGPGGPLSVDDAEATRLAGLLAQVIERVPAGESHVAVCSWFTGAIAIDGGLHADLLRVDCHALPALRPVEPGGEAESPVGYRRLMTAELEASGWTVTDWADDEGAMRSTAMLRRARRSTPRRPAMGCAR